MYAFKDPNTFRAWNDGNDLQPGEVFFDHRPSEDELKAAFPNYVPPPASPSVSFLQFMALFSPAEQAAIMTARRDDVQVDLFVTMAAGADGLQLANAQVRQGLDYLVAKGLLTGDRAAAVRAGAPPAS